MISLSLSLAALPSISVSASSSSVTQYPWVTTQYNYNRIGYTLSPAPKTNHVLWKADMFSYTNAYPESPVVVDGRVFIQLITSVGAFDAVTGEKMWETNLPHYPELGSVRDQRISGFAVDKGVVFLKDADWLYALDEISGQIVGQFNMSAYYRPDWEAIPSVSRTGRSAAPTVVSTRSTIYVSTREGTLFALTYSYGKFTLLWTFKDNRPLNSHGTIAAAPIAVGNPASSTTWKNTGIIYQTSVDNNVYALNATTGAQIWNFTSIGQILYGATYVSGKLYFGTYTGTTAVKPIFYCLNATSAAVIWTKEWPITGGGTYMGPAAAYGMLYVGNIKDYNLYALNQTNGATVWNYTYPGNQYPYGAPSVADGMVFQSTYASSKGNNLYAFNAMTGALVWSYQLSPIGNGYTASPAIADGRLYIQNDNGGILYCFGDGPTTTSVSFISSKLTLNDTAWILGTLVDSSPANVGTPIAGAEITLTYTKVGGVSTFIANVTTDSSGSFSYAWTPPSVGAYTVSASFAGETPMQPSSGTAMVQVEPAAPTKEQIAGEVIDELPPYPQPPTKEQIAGQVISQLPPYPEPPTKEEIAAEVINETPAFSTTEIVLAVLVVITLLLVVYNMFALRKLQK